MPLMRYVMIAFGSTLVAGCAGEKVRQGIYQGIYEGCRLEEQQLTLPYERLGKPDMDYQQYSNALKARKEEKK